MDSLFYSKIDFILKCGKGVKACIFDEETKSMISSIISLSAFNEHGYFHFDLLTNKNRFKIEGLNCVVILRPDSLTHLLEELVSPCYSNYIVFFTAQVDPLVLELMANADINSLVSEIHEINLDLYKESMNLYITKSTKYKRNLEGIFSALLSLNINPEILIYNEEQSKMKNDEELDKNKEESKFENKKGIDTLGKELKHKINQYNLPKKGTLVLLKRNYDLITPLIRDWHYQPMINETMGISGGFVRVNNKTFQLNDSFSIKNFFSEIATVGEEIKKMVKEVDVSKLTIIKYEEIHDLMESKTIAEMHLSIYNAIANQLENLISISEAQMKLLGSRTNKISENIHLKELSESIPNNNKQINQEIHDYSNHTHTKKSNDSKDTTNISNIFDNFKNENCLNLLLIYFIKNVKNWKESAKLFPKFKNQLIDFYNVFHPQSFGYKYILDSGVDPKLSYNPPIRKIIKHIIMNKLKENTFYKIDTCSGMQNSQKISTHENDPIVIYIEGGITYTEYRAAMECANSLNVTVILISTNILNINTFMNLKCD